MNIFSLVDLGCFWWNCMYSFSSHLHNSTPLSSWQQISLILVVLAFSVSFVCVGGIPKVCSTPLGLALLRFLGLGCLVADMFSKPFLRVLAVGLGGGACFLSVVGGFWNLSILDK